MKSFLEILCLSLLTMHDSGREGQSGGLRATLQVIRSELWPTSAVAVIDHTALKGLR
jgi:hypothetical protein